jgi:hypothetical protein
MLTTPGLLYKLKHTSSGMDRKVASPTTETVHNETGLIFVGPTSSSYEAPRCTESAPLVLSDCVESRRLDRQHPLVADP